MKMRKYLVEIVSRHRSLYEIEAAGPDDAERHALTRWSSGQPSDIEGLEKCRLEGIQTTDENDEIRMRQDDEVLLRFIRERERLQRRWNSNRLDSSRGDAISAYQISAGLGWYRADIGGDSIPDVIRAARGLERLCTRRSLVGFAREPVRTRNGPIQVYCTPEYLDRLSGPVEIALEPRARPA